MNKFLKGYKLKVDGIDKAITVKIELGIKDLGTEIIGYYINPYTAYRLIEGRNVPYKLDVERYLKVMYNIESEYIEYTTRGNNAIYITETDTFYNLKDILKYSKYTIKDLDFMV